MLYRSARELYLLLALRTLGISCSTSRTGRCYDNAAIERCFWSLKHEWTEHQSFAHLEEARLSVFQDIEMCYNPLCLHQLPVENLAGQAF